MAICQTMEPLLSGCCAITPRSALFLADGLAYPADRNNFTAMTAYLAHIVANAHISRLSLLGLAKNVGKTTTPNHLVATLLGEHLYRSDELALTSLGLDGEAIDALTGFPKPP